MKLRDLFSDESKWTKGAPVRNVLGEPCYDINSPAAAAWCLMAGIVKCCGGGWVMKKQAYWKIRNRLGSDVGSWNDAPERTFGDIRKLVEELDL